ncbi:hypothetical protein [Streptomyces fuscichromogenes]|uniref:Uncharacterized protein n=1 Tax=Streptomyces fuscichromogenes TaxID=1324013 RepID=A0A918CU81_9ACTN|nr:hypothetical protein [Streptomyces fuscichromogenes]GGN26439.1 hypothetical protein GCM10011578_061040 [Streptomyces fuscichromogenes]
MTTPREESGESGEDPAQAARRQAEERFIDDLLARGQAVPEGQEVPPDATHVVEHDKDGRRRLRRIRFTGT